MDKGLQALVAGIKLRKCAVSTGFVPLALPTVQLSTVQSSRVKFCEARVVKVGGLWEGGRSPSKFFLSKGRVVIYSHCKSACKELSTQIGFLQPFLTIFTQFLSQKVYFIIPRFTPRESFGATWVPAALHCTGEYIISK